MYTQTSDHPTHLRCLGHSSANRLPPKLILDCRQVSREEAQQLGAPTGVAFDALFGESCDKVYAIHFEQVQPDEVPVDANVLKNSMKAMQHVRTLSNTPNLTKEATVLEGEEMETLFKPPEERAVKDKNKEKELKTEQVQFPASLVKRFIDQAWPHCPNEFMAWLLGKVVQEKVPGSKKNEVKNILLVEAMSKAAVLRNQRV